ncbi:MAG: histidinol dehydrogenase [Propionibacteriaceae bacterium]|jgi:histidinol dehydrogenase|nr:histidinol dehydrogenase [Propionibacteriaceae bacterium]
MTGVRRIDCRAAGPDYSQVVPRAEFDVAAALVAVAPICEAVRTGGEAALQKLSGQFDHVVPGHFRVDPAVLARCADELDPALRSAYLTSIERRRAVAALEAAVPDVTATLAGGARVTITSVPVGRVGLYVPGGLEPLASSVIMNVVPAQAAGVRSLAVASPPQAAFGGLPHPTILAVAHLLGVDEVYAVGGAQAIAMFAYGVPGLCAGVDLVTGPGNIFVVAAKRYVKGLVGIDAEAGPSEIAVLADKTARADFVAADLLSQAEHGPGSASVLITDDPGLADRVEAELEQMVAETLHAGRVREALTGQQSAIVLVRDLAQGIEVANAYGAEHLEIMTADPATTARAVRRAGAVFLGPYSPVSLGDYSAGSTHVLPTGGAARHSSGLTVRSFLKTMHVIDYDQAALAAIADGIQVFALSEHLPAHAHAIAVRQS